MANDKASLFVAKGYGRTTIAEVAVAAGVAVETVYAVLAEPDLATRFRAQAFVYLPSSGASPVAARAAGGRH